MDIVVRLDGAVETALEKLVQHGYFKTRAEAIRAGLMAVAKEYGVLPVPGEHVEKLRQGAKTSGGSHVHLSMSDVAKSLSRGK